MSWNTFVKLKETNSDGKVIEKLRKVSPHTNTIIKDKEYTTGKLKKISPEGKLHGK